VSTSQTEGAAPGAGPMDPMDFQNQGAAKGTAADGATTAADQAVEEAVEKDRVQRWRFRNWGGSQLMWDKLVRTRKELERLEQQNPAPTPEETLVFSQCRQELREAQECLGGAFRRSFSFWDCIHDVDERLLLATPESRLLEQAIALRGTFESKFKRNRELREVWLLRDGEKGLLTDLVERLRHYKTGEPRDSRHPLADDRELLRQVQHVINDRTDYGFWQLNMGVSIQVISAFALLAIMFAAWFILSTPPLRSALPAIAAAGAAGAIVSNMIARRAVITTIGATTRHFLYHLVAKPVVGAFSAIFVYLVGRSQLIYAVVPRSSLPAESQAPIQIVVGPEALVPVFAVIAIASGYFGDKLLSPMFENVIGKVFQKSEKVVSPPLTKARETES
jgi:hypothetical protein